MISIGISSGHITGDTPGGTKKECVSAENIRVSPNVRIPISPSRLTSR